MAKLLTLRQCSEEYGISISSIYREVESGRLKMLKIGRASRIVKDDMEAWMSSLPTSKGETSNVA
ncbi:MAG: hypothetical protein Pars2KO_04040 [Parasphingorhabdus sp.]